jgi:hypothetical protein
MVHWAARKGLRDDHDDSLQQRKHAARCTGIRGKTYAAATATSSSPAITHRAESKVSSTLSATTAKR